MRGNGIDANLDTRSAIQEAQRNQIHKMSSTRTHRWIWHHTNARFCRCGRVEGQRSEPEYAAKSPANIVHEGCRRVADRFLKVALIEGDQGGDVDD